MVTNERTSESSPSLFRSSAEKKDMMKTLGLMKRYMAKSSEQLQGVHATPLHRKAVVVKSKDSQKVRFVNPVFEEIPSPSPERVKTCTLVFKAQNKAGDQISFDYTGETLHRIPHGKGTFTFPEATTLVGTWDYGIQEGDVTFTHGNSFTYKGGWKSNHAEGEGEYQSNDQKVHYDGSWHQGKAHHKGTLTIREGEKESTYVGRWKSGTMEGFGKVYYPNGDCLEGSWVQGRISGKCTYTFASGAVFKALWINGLMLDPLIEAALSVEQKNDLNRNVMSNNLLTFNYLDQTKDLMYTTLVSLPIERLVAN